MYAPVTKRLPPGGILCVKHGRKVLIMAEQEGRKTESSTQRCLFGIFGGCLQSKLPVKQMANATQVDADPDSGI